MTIVVIIGVRIDNNWDYFPSQGLTPDPEGRDARLCLGTIWYGCAHEYDMAVFFVVSSEVGDLLPITPEIYIRSLLSWQ